MLIPAPHGHLEARIREPDGDARAAAVICHPHPRHGGTLHTKVVFRSAQALNDVRIRALRFNFRGVGTSTGSWDGGVGEKDDARAALDWLAEDAGEVPLIAAGFSFGSMVGLRVGADDSRVRALVGLGLPVDHYDYSFLADVEKPTLVVQGEDDEFGKGERVRSVVDSLGDHVGLVVVPGSGHFFHEHFDELKSAIREFFTTGAGARVLDRRPVSTARGPGPKGG